MIVSFNEVLGLAAIVFLIGMFTLVARQNLIMMLLGVEIMLNGAAIALVGAALNWQHLEGQAIAMFILAIAATEVSVGLALILWVYRRTGNIDPDAVESLESSD
jgi:NADH-quinone oxidoreductase subunit K